MHKHFCPDCPEDIKWWEHDRSDGCILEEGHKYPCLKHIRNHVIFLSDTPEGAEELYNKGL